MRSSIFADIEKILSEIEKEMAEAFKELKGRTPEDLIRERRRPNGSNIREFGPSSTVTPSP